MKKMNYLSLLTIMMVALFSVGFVSCSSDKDDEGAKIDTTPISLLAGDSKTIQGADTISSSNKFVAYSAGDKVYGWHVGEASLLVNGKETISISVLPMYTLYDDPICNWGCNVTYVSQRQKQGTKSTKSTNDQLAYENAGAATLLAYDFKNGKLDKITAVVSTNHASQYASYLAERYLMIPTYYGKDTYFCGSDGVNLASSKTAVVMMVYSIEYLVTIYMPANQFTGTTRSFDNYFFKNEEALSVIKDIL